MRTERGDINRRIREMNAKILSAKDDYLSAKSVFEDVLAKPVEIENAMQWLENNNIHTFTELHFFIQECEKDFGQTNFLRRDNQSTLKRLKELVTPVIGGEK